ncbi:MAG: undecaprenyldiphospho-muramoylpentapeptide beta-N-acetylglucosaminyltransferase [bacterium]|nr:undecaprenyldiphospho-muramoylpentapeptide beta-N-acetylglucosaminyltransferase [bacterium]
MKILLAGGGTGGHFYPLIAVARSLKDIAERERIVSLEISFISPSPYDAELLREEEIKFIQAPAGKIRRYFSLWNIIDSVKTGWGVLSAIFSIYLNFPDVIFAKGGYASFPALVAAKIFKIPLVIHESDIVPGKVSLWASKFASRIAISFPQSLKYFLPEKTALTGNPIRKQVLGGNKTEALELFGLEGNLPTILVLGGSQGAEHLNNVVLEILPELVKSVQIIHQTGRAHLEEIKLRSGLILESSVFTKRYHPYGFLNEGALRNASKVGALAITRAGAGSIFELAAWGLPAILIPLPRSAQDHQRENAYGYSRSGAGVVLEEENLTPHILLSEIMKILSDSPRRAEMSRLAQAFSKVDAADRIAEEIIKLALKHS